MPPTVHVVMSNDYPDCVFDKIDLAEAYVKAKMADPKNRHPHSDTPRIYYRRYEFEVNEAGRDWKHS